MHCKEITSRRWRVVWHLTELATMLNIKRARCFTLLSSFSRAPRSSFFFSRSFLCHSCRYCRSDPSLKGSPHLGCRRKGCWGPPPISPSWNIQFLIEFEFFFAVSSPSEIFSDIFLKWEKLKISFISFRQWYMRASRGNILYKKSLSLYLNSQSCLKAPRKTLNIAHSRFYLFNGSDEFFSSTIYDSTMMDLNCFQPRCINLDLFHRQVLDFLSWQIQISSYLTVFAPPQFVSSDFLTTLFPSQVASPHLKEETL